MTNRAGTRTFKVHMPSGDRDLPLPLLVMLHGCTQDPDDFAAGTSMNALADEFGFYVIYPSQPESANPRKCWNWFNPFDQRRDFGEPSLIADITRDFIKTHHVDPRRVYIAGLSAGGAMAVVMAATYPELYAAVGCHSGMPYRCAQTVYGAFKAMQSGNDHYRPLGTTGIPMIVFQGDQDATVNPRNSEQLISQWIDSMPNPADYRSAIEDESELNGRVYHRRTYQDTAGKPVAEYWLIRGAGHAWSGGSTDGSYTDPLGPNASREMVRFFLRAERLADGRRRSGRGVVSRLLGVVRRHAKDR